jgi:aldose 1-epimerase
VTGTGRIALDWGALQLTLHPDAGGSVAGLRWRGRPVLRCSPPRTCDAGEPLTLAGFPLVPFASRIAANRFAWPSPASPRALPGEAVRQIHLAPNLPGEALAIHGQSWRAPWKAERTSAGGYRLVYEHRPDSWPWRYRAEQTFSPTANGFDLRLRLINTDRTAMPGGIGWHPYFHRGDARLTATVAGRIRGAGDPPGARRIPHAPLEAAGVDALDLDHGFYGWDGIAALEWPGAGLRLTLNAEAPLDFLILYTPPGADHFCVEPVSHLPDAANWQDGLPNGWRAIEPGDALEGIIRLRLESMAGTGA